MPTLPPGGASRTRDIQPVSSITESRLAPEAVALMVFTAGLLGRLPALGAYWNQDDWGLLARATGMLPTALPAARALSQIWYWDLLYPLGGFAPDPYTWTRMLLHGGCAVLVTRIAAHGGLSTAAQLVAGLLFASSPAAFTPLYWASGIQELLGAFGALLAVERWLAGSRLGIWIALLAGLMGILAKENALGLPLLLIAVSAGRAGIRGVRIDAKRWTVLVLLAVIAAFEALLVFRHFRTGAGEPYALGPWTKVLQNLAIDGWWLITPGPTFAALFTPGRFIGGAAVWLVWLGWAILSWRRGARWASACLWGGFLALAPALPLTHHVYPYLVYTTVAAVALSLAGLIPSRWRLRTLPALWLVLGAVVWSYGGMTSRLKARDELGLPSDPLVLRTAISHETTALLRKLPSPDPDPAAAPLIFLQPPLPGAKALMAQRLGEGWVNDSSIRLALAGPYGPRLVLADERPVRWANRLDSAPAEALVLADAGPRVRLWGRTPQALLYLALTEVARGQFPAARADLVRAAAMSGPNMPFLYAEDQMLVSVEGLREQAPAFRAFLRQSVADSVQAARAAALEQIFGELLAACSEGATAP